MGFGKVEWKAMTREPGDLPGDISQPSGGAHRLRASDTLSRVPGFQHSCPLMRGYLC